MDLEMVVLVHLLMYWTGWYCKKKHKLVLRLRLHLKLMLPAANLLCGSCCLSLTLFLGVFCSLKHLSLGPRVCCFFQVLHSNCNLSVLYTMVVKQRVLVSMLLSVPSPRFGLVWAWTGNGIPAAVGFEFLVVMEDDPFITSATFPAPGLPNSMHVLGLVFVCVHCWTCPWF